MAKRLGKDDWLMLGFTQLATVGVEAIRLDALCSAAGVTKGSFYHHFGSHEAFVETLVSSWADWADPDALPFLESEEGPLGGLAAVADPMIERGLRRLAAVDDAARAVVADVDAARVEYLAERTGSAAAAEIGYAAYVGLQHISAVIDELALNTRIADVDKAMLAIATAQDASAGGTDGVLAE